MFCEFQVYTVVTQHLCTLRSDRHDESSARPTPQLGTAVLPTRPPNTSCPATQICVYTVKCPSSVSHVSAHPLHLLFHPIQVNSPAVMHYNQTFSFTEIVEQTFSFLSRNKPDNTC